jgi:hypothetical protein
LELPLLLRFLPLLALFLPLLLCSTGSASFGFAVAAEPTTLLRQ